jgi:hypothetical protein
MMTAWLAAKNILEGQHHYDLWKVNEGAAYHEGLQADDIKDGRLTPKKL